MNVLFFLRVSFHRHWWFIGQQGKGGDHLLFHPITSNRSRTLRHLFATLHVRWLSHILIATPVFIRLLLDEIFHLIELPLINWWCNFCLLTWWIDSRVLLQRLDMRDRCIYRPVHYRSITLVLQATRLTNSASHPKHFGYRRNF